VNERPSEPWILLTNDDGMDSPALVPLMRRLGGLAPVRCLVPSREYSWSAKTLSRFARLELRSLTRDGVELSTADGSPADCANAGVYHLCETPPALAVSGINIGANAGLSFLLSSGTVGAAMEAALSGVPSVALSLQLEPEDYEHWRQHRELDHLADVWERAAAIGCEVVAEVLGAGMPAGAAVLSVNMPPNPQLDTPRRMTGVTRTSYGPFFRRCDDGYLEHAYAGLRITEPHENGDLEALGRGEVSISPLSLAVEAGVAAADRHRFERQGPAVETKPG